MKNMIFLKEDNKNIFHTKKQEYSQWYLEVIGQKLSKLSILAKNDQILALNGQNFAISEFSWHMQYDFLKEDHKNNFHTKNQEDSYRRLEVIGQKLSKLSILAKKGQILVLRLQGGLRVFVGQKIKLILYERIFYQLFSAFYGIKNIIWRNCKTAKLGRYFRKSAFPLYISCIKSDQK